MATERGDALFCKGFGCAHTDKLTSFIARPHIGKYLTSTQPKAKPHGGHKKIRLNPLSASSMKSSKKTLMIGNLTPFTGGDIPYFDNDVVNRGINGEEQLNRTL